MAFVAKLDAERDQAPLASVGGPHLHLGYTVGGGGALGRRGKGGRSLLPFTRTEGARAEKKKLQDPHSNNHQDLIRHIFYTQVPPDGKILVYSSVIFGG